MEDFTAAIGLDPLSAHAYNNRAVAWRKLGQAEGLSNAIQLITGHVGALNNRGEVLADLGRTEEAAADSRNVVALDPSHSRAAENLRRLEREIAGKP